jgi:hypothetical protein
MVFVRLAPLRPGGVVVLHLKQHAEEAAESGDAQHPHELVHELVSPRRFPDSLVDRYHHPGRPDAAYGRSDWHR